YDTVGLSLRRRSKACRSATFSETDRQSILPDVRAAHQHRGPRVDHDALESAERTAGIGVRRHFVSALNERGAHGFGDVALDEQSVVAVRHARGLAGLLDV